MTALFDRRCPATGKRQFPTELMARLELEHVQAERVTPGINQSERVESRAYLCPSCTEWHLTSRERYA